MSDDDGDGGMIESPLARWMGFVVEEQGDARTVTRLDVRPEQMNPVGAVHGGTMLALADNNATRMANRAQAGGENEGRFMVGVDLHCIMLRNQPGGVIRAVSTVVRAGRRVTVIRTEIQGEDGRALMEVTTTHIPG